MRRKRKTFDCVEFQHEAGRKVAERMRAMTLEERLEYWRRETEVMRRQQAELRAEGEARGSAGPLLSELAERASDRRAKSFDCVEMQHEAERKVAERLRGMTPEQQAAYGKQRTAELRKLQAELRKKAEKRAAGAER